MIEEVFANLLNIPFLASQSEDALKDLAAKAKEVKFPKRAVIITEGDETSSLYFILSGKVRIYGTDENSKEVTLAVQQAGEYFGLLALLCDERRSATVEAIEPTRCSVICKADFINWLRLYPDVAIAFLIGLSEKIINLTEKVKQLALSNAYERTVKVLQELSIKEGNIYVIHNKPTQEELANMVGVARETINKFIKALTDGGYLVVEGKTYRIEKKLPAKY